MNNTEAVEVLKAAKKIISNPKHWCRDAEAKNGAGETVDITDPKALKFCAIGSIRRAASDLNSNEWMLAERTLEDACHDLYQDNVMSINDGKRYGRTMVLKAMDRAIRNFKKNSAARVR